MKIIQIAFVAIAAAFVVIGAATYMSSLQSSPPQPPVSHGGPVKDYVSLVDALRAKGLKVEPSGKLSQPFFAIEAQVIDVNGQKLQVYEYASEASMNDEASKVSPDGGSVRNSMISWVESPHFYKIGKIIVLYVGKDSTIINALNDVVGPQFAGRSQETEEGKKAEEIAKDFIIQASTFKFDGVLDTLNIVDTKILESFPPQYVVTMIFESRHAGYGDRTGQALAQVITKHTVVVKVVQGKVVSAILDNQWDEINQKRL
ncbi:MAG: hypothetical protein HYU02_00785 [Thaumarchaeota archaeon]|nr:hypothetical protein [Nitrososphaerota archaeon]